MAVMWLTSSGFHDCSIKINCNNSSVVSSFWKGHSHNSERNQSLIRITSHLAAMNLSINPSFIPSSSNKADHLSHGIAGADDKHLEPLVPIPEPLCPFLDPI